MIVCKARLIAEERAWLVGFPPSPPADLGFDNAHPKNQPSNNPTQSKPRLVCYWRRPHHSEGRPRPCNLVGSQMLTMTKSRLTRWRPTRDRQSKTTTTSIRERCTAFLHSTVTRSPKECNSRPEPSKKDGPEQSMEFDEKVQNWLDMIACKKEKVLEYPRGPTLAAAVPEVSRIPMKLAYAYDKCCLVASECRIDELNGTLLYAW
jgi:hypothetical protein